MVLIGPLNLNEHRNKFWFPFLECIDIIVQITGYLLLFF